MRDPFPPELVQDVTLMIVKKHSKVQNVVPYARNILEESSQQRVVFRGEGKAAFKVVTHVEVLKRQMLPETVYQWNRYDGIPDPKKEGRMRPIFEIMLSREPFPIVQGSQQSSTDEYGGSWLPKTSKTIPKTTVKRRGVRADDESIQIDKREGVDPADDLLPVDDMTDQKPTTFATADDNNSFMRPKKGKHHVRDAYAAAERVNIDSSQKDDKKENSSEEIHEAKEDDEN